MSPGKLLKRGIGFGLSIGLDSAKPDDQNAVLMQGCAFDGLGGCVQGAPAGEGGHYGASVGVGEGVMVGVQETKVYNLPDWMTTTIWDVPW